MGTFAPSGCNSDPLELALPPPLGPLEVFREPEAPEEPLVVDSPSLPGFTFSMWKAEPPAATEERPLYQVGEGRFTVNIKKGQFCTSGFSDKMVEIEDCSVLEPGGLIKAVAHHPLLLAHQVGGAEAARGKLKSM